MDSTIVFIASALYFFLPAYVANMAPIFVQKIPFLNRPIYEKLLGLHKTWRGLLFAILFGGVIFLIQKVFYTIGFIQFSIIDYSDFPFWFGFLIGFGAMVGDLVKSYYKRKEGIAPGRPWIPYDQIDFAVGGLIGSCLYYVPSVGVVIVILLASPILHLIVSYMGYKLGLRKEKC